MKKSTFFKRKSTYIGSGALLIVLILILMSWGNEKVSPRTALIKRGTVTEEVLVSGSVVSKNFADLSLEKGGRVQSVYARVGDLVSAGKIIVVLDNGTERASVEEAEGKLKAEEANLAELKIGTRVEEIRVKEVELAKAEQDLENYYDETGETVDDAYNKAQNAVNVHADPLFSNPKSPNPQLNFTSPDQEAERQAEEMRIAVEKLLSELLELRTNFPATHLKNEEVLQIAKHHLGVVQTFLGYMHTALSASSEPYATEKANINTARTNVNTAFQSVNALLQSISTQKLTVERVQRELELKKAPATPSSIAQGEARVEQAKASVRNARALLDQKIMRSPISGVLTKQDTKVGEVVSAGKTLATVINNNLFQIEAKIPEADIAKIGLGNKASVTLDAYGSGEIFEAVLVRIDPAEEIVDGVPTYKTTFEFKKSDKRIRSGMTANITVTTKEKEDAIIAPERAIETKNLKKYVSIKKGEATEEREVETGLRSGIGEIEITVGLVEGDEIILP